MLARSDDTQLIELIVGQLRAGGLNEPRSISQRKQEPFKTYIRAQVMRSIDRVRRDNPPMPKMIEIALAKKAIKPLLDTMIATDQMRSTYALLDRISRLQRRPADKMNGEKYAQATEAYFLIETFCQKQPTGTEGGPFRLVAELLNEAVTGKAGGDMKRACDQVLRDRRGTLRLTNRP